MHHHHHHHHQPANFRRICTILLFITIIQPARAQVKLSFAAPYTVGGTSGAVGSTYTYNNVGTVGNTVIRGVFELVSKNGNTTLGDPDLAAGGSADAWQPLIYGSASANSCWSMLFKLSFYNAATGMPVPLSSFTANAVDIDGDNSYLREYVTFYSPTSYTVETPTALTINRNGDQYQFVSPKEQYNDIALSGTGIIASAKYDNRNVIMIELGACCVTRACSANGITRQYSINFRDVIKYKDGMIILPARFLSLNAEKSGSRNKVTWRVADEVNVKEYIVERSYDGSNFHTAARLPFAGIGEAETLYSFTDSNLADGTIYYRISTVDHDGKNYYSHVIKTVTSDTAARLKILGDPVGNELWFEYDSPEEQRIDVEVITESGQVLRDYKASVQRGTNRLQYPDISRLQRGVYIFIVINRYGVALKQEFIKM